MPITINGQPAQVGYSGNEELTLNCRYPSINISLSAVSDKLESILRKYGVSHLVNFWCEEVLLVHTTFSSEHGLRRLLRLKEKAQDEVASLLSAEMMVYKQNRKSDTTTAPLPSLPTAVEMRVFLVQPDIVKNTAQVEPVSLENHSACMALWKESEMFDFSSLFRAYRVNPSSLPDQGAVTLKVLVSELHEVVSWFGLGLQLGVPDTELLKLRHKYAICREVDECKTEVFICWMKQMKPTWSAVVRALVGIKMFSLAHKIAIKYGVPVATSVETKALQAVAFSNKKEDSRQQQIEQIEKGLEAKEKQAEERRQHLVKAQRERAILKQRFAQARKNALDVQAKATRLIDQRKKIEGQLELKQYELELLRSAEKDKQKLQKIIDSKDIEIKHLQEQLQVINTELEVTRKEGYDFREQLQQVTKELEVKSVEVRLIERSRMELRADLDAERKRVDMLLMQRSASASGDKSTIEMELQYQIAALKEESESKSRIMEASISQKDAEIEKLSAHLKMIEKQLQSLLQVQQTPHPSQSEREAELQTLVLETSELRAKLVEAEDDKQEAVRQLEIAQEQLKGYLKNEALAPPYSDSDSSMAIVPEEPATYTGVPIQPTVDEDDAKDEEKHIMEFEDEGLTAETLYDYEAEADDEISFDERELITNIDQIDEGWWRGRRDLDGSYGLFPSNYVELCSPEELQKFKAKQSKRREEQQHHEQLQHLIQLQRDGQLGPDKGKTAKTLRDYKAVAVDEISFLSGEIITNIESTVYVGLLKGTRLLDGSRGFFPESCVTID